ncbi:hypothetical protein D3C83_79490 [compost metagenome]
MAGLTVSSSKPDESPSGSRWRTIDESGRDGLTVSRGSESMEGAALKTAGVSGFVE